MIRRTFGDSWTRNCLTMGPSHGYTPAMSMRDGYESRVPRTEDGIERLRREVARSLARSQWRAGR